MPDGYHRRKGRPAGRTRPYGALCDIGAYEWYPPPPSSSAEGRTELIPTPRPTAVVGTSVSTCPQLPADIVVFGYAEGTQCQVVSGQAIGIAEIAALAQRAVDVWGWVPGGLRVCFRAAGGTIKFIDTGVLPRVVSDLAAVGVDGMVCAGIDRPGIVALLPGPPAPAATAIPPAGWTLENCMVRTLFALNFRAGPAGEIIGAVPFNVTLTAYSRTADWFEVDYLGARGWVSNGYLEAQGDCG